VSPGREEDDVDEKFPIPWWRIATAALLGIALGIAIANGRMWDALVIGVLLVPAIALVAASVFFRLRLQGATRRRVESLASASVLSPDRRSPSNSHPSPPHHLTDRSVEPAGKNWAKVFDLRLRGRNRKAPFPGPF
jgi:hypothetical protein